MQPDPPQPRCSTPEDAVDDPLFRFARKIPPRVFATDQFPSVLRLLPLRFALRRRYIQVRSAKLAWYLPFDIDRKDAGSAFLDGELPQPTFIVQGSSGRAHVLYELAVPVRIDRDSKAHRLFAAVRQGFAWRLGADASYAGLMVKNPLSHEWRTLVNKRVYSLTELYQWLDTGDTRSYRRFAADASGRNCTLFNLTRCYAYSAIGTYGNESSFSKAIEAYAEAHNVFPSKLPRHEVRSISKSVANWTWARRANLSKAKMPNRGAMNLPPLSNDLTEEERAKIAEQRRGLAGRFSAGKRREATREKLVHALEDLVEAALPITRSAIAKRSGLSVATVKRHRTYLLQRGSYGAIRDMA